MWNVTSRTSYIDGRLDGNIRALERGPGARSEGNGKDCNQGKWLTDGRVGNEQLSIGNRQQEALTEEGKFYALFGNRDSRRSINIRKGVWKGICRIILLELLLYDLDNLIGNY